MSVTALVKSEFARDVNDNHVQDGSRKSREASDEKCRRVQLVVPEPKRLSPSQPVTMTESSVSQSNSRTSPTLSPGLSGIPHLPWQLPLYHCFPHYPLLQYPGFSSYPFPVLPEHAYVADYMKYLPHMGMFPPNQFPPLSPYHVTTKQPETQGAVLKFQENESIISKLAKEEMKDNRETRSPLIRAPTVFLEKAPITDEKKKERDQDQLKYKCDTCSKTYSTFSGLSKHKQFHCTHDSKKEFTCKYCEKTYFSLGALKMHIRTHTLPCKCKICGKAFSRPWLLQGHVRTHTGEKPFTCVHCLRAFADRSNLRAHLQTHSDVKKYSCQTCSKTFSRMSLLLKHEDACKRTEL